ncbi:MAG: hypothetical protein ACHBN1_23460 [Heteroscytonema crispum UTEX LB 1556]
MSRGSSEKLKAKKEEALNGASDRLKLPSKIKLVIKVRDDLIRGYKKTVRGNAVSG